jgi:hypothetical protein
MSRKFYIYVLNILLFTGSCNSQNQTGNYSVMSNDTVSKDYFKNSRIKEMGQIKEGKLNGTFLGYFKNGGIKIKGNYENGKKTGIWLDYDSNGLTSSVNYYFDDTLIYKNLDASDYHFVDYKNSNSIFSMKIPKYWEIISPTNPILCAFKKKDTTDVVFSPNMILIKDKKFNNDFDVCINQNIELLQKEFSFFKIISGGDLVIDNKRAKQYAYIAIANGTKVGALVTFIEKEDDIYILTGMAFNEPSGAFLKYRALFEEISNSVRLY